MGALLWSPYRLHMNRESLVKSSDPFQTRVELDFRGNRLLVTGVWEEVSVRAAEEAQRWGLFCVSWEDCKQSIV